MLSGSPSFIYSITCSTGMWESYRGSSQRAGGFPGLILTEKHFNALENQISFQLFPKKCINQSCPPHPLVYPHLLGEDRRWGGSHPRLCASGVLNSNIAELNPLCFKDCTRMATWKGPAFARWCARCGQIGGGGDT